MNRIRSIITASALVACALAPPAFAASKPIQIVTTIEDLAAIAREVGGERVNVVSLSRGY